MTRGRGLFETLLTEAVEGSLRELDGDLAISRRELGAAEVADRIALHVHHQVERALASVGDRDRAEVGARVARGLIERLSTVVESVDLGDRPVEPLTVLHAIVGRRPDGRNEEIEQPLTPLLDTTLMTNAPGEPRLGSELSTEIDSADAIDVVMAFIRRSGISPLVSKLRRHCEAGRPLRVLTTTYTGSTERAALDQLLELGADVRISYDLTTTRLHAKAWVFHRRSGFSTAYVGSSNLTHSAQITGLEWNVRLSGARNPGVLEKIDAVFESYWSGGDFVPYDPAQFDEEFARTSSTHSGPHIMLSPIELRPEPFQERLLELISLARRKGHHRNLLVAATGTGKTVMAAVDYGRLRGDLQRARLLFVAHSEEILTQSLATFRHALREPSFGELWVGGKVPKDFDHVFASIQTLGPSRLSDIEPDRFDVVIVDEFHHAAAPSYSRLLDHLRPVELLGLTATPERADGLDILRWFDGRVAAEMRLWDAIDQHRLSPFMYLGIHDGLDLRDVPWRRGQGYDVEAITERYTSTDAWARLVLQETLRHAEDPHRMRGLGFCVSIAHAEFMARHFNQHGVKSVAVCGETPETERRAALQDLAAGTIRMVFSVDLFNEGIDVPTVDTVLLLRPTESPTLFLQQLGRGLRRSTDKAFCTVLDFVGEHRREFRFDRKLRALLGGSRRDVEQQVDRGFPFLPAGCHMQLDRKATDIVLRSLRDAIPSRWPQKVDELRSLVALGRDPSLAEYLDESGLDLPDIYDGTKSWSDLREAAGASVQPAGEHEADLRRGIGRLLHIDDDERLDFYRGVLRATEPPDLGALTERERRLVRMLGGVLASQVIRKGDDLRRVLDLVWEHPQVRAEMIETIELLDEQVDHLNADLSTHPDVPLQIHARYTRREILAGFGFGEGANIISWQSGVFDLPAAGVDLFAFTLDKTRGSFSPTTRYRDYAISRELIHWESQSVTRGDSETGQRYQRHEELGRSIMLFTRLRADDRAFWFLGPATYVSHTGERPMAITWRLEHSLPGDLFAQFAAAVA